MFMRWFFEALWSFRASHPTAGEWERAREVIDAVTDGGDGEMDEEVDGDDDDVGAPLTVDDIPLVCRQYIRYDDNGLPIPESETPPQYRVYVVVAPDPDIVELEEGPISVERLAERGGVVVGQAVHRVGSPAVALRKFHNAAVFLSGNEYRPVRIARDFTLEYGDMERHVVSTEGIRRFDAVNSPRHPLTSIGYLNRDVFGAVTGYRGRPSEVFTQSFWEQVARDLRQEEDGDPRQAQAARSFRPRAGEIRAMAEDPYRLTAGYVSAEVPDSIDGTTPVRVAASGRR